MNELCEVYCFKVENPSLLTMCGSYSWKNNLKGTVTYTESSFLVAIYALSSNE